MGRSKKQYLVKFDVTKTRAKFEDVPVSHHKVRNRWESAIVSHRVMRQSKTQLSFSSELKN